MISIKKSRSFQHLFLLVLFVFIGDKQVLAQHAGPASTGSDKSEHFDSCSLLLPKGDSGDYLRLLQKIGDPTPVKINITFQVGDNDPCYLESITPVELYFPKSSFSFRLEPQEGDSRYRFILNKTGTGPVVWFAEIGEICVGVDEDWRYEISCDEIDY